jgi:hypothetical protein
MAVSQSQYNFIKFSANGDALNFRGILAGFIITKSVSTAKGTIQVANYASQYDVIPLTVLGSACDPIVAVMFGSPGIPVVGLKAVVCSGVILTAIRR